MRGSSPKKDGPTGAAPATDLRREQAQFFEDYFKKGAEFTAALISENDELRRRLAAAEAEVKRSPVHTSLEASHREIERQHYDLACLFVALGQLSRARDANEALGVIAEILLNFVGADRFAIYAADGDGALRPLFAAEVALADLPSAPPARLLRAFDEDRILSETIRLEENPNGDPLLAFPLRCGEKPFGAIAVWSFLSQKRELQAIDDRLFEVIADAGGCALESARVRGQVPRLTARNGTVDHFSGLALLLGLGGRGGK